MLITPAMIVTKIKKLKDNKSPGIDGITQKIAEEISVPLAIMFKDAVQVRLHFTYNVKRYATMW